MSNTYLLFVPLRSIKLTLDFAFADALSLLLLVPSWTSMVQPTSHNSFRDGLGIRESQSEEAGHAPEVDYGGGNYKPIREASIFGRSCRSTDDEDFFACFLGINGFGDLIA